MWEFIDKVFVLSIDRSIEAQNIISKHLDEIGMPFEMVIFPSVRKDKAVTNDCKEKEISVWKIMKHETTDEVSEDILRNHLYLIKRAWSENYKNVLILEDDAIFENISPKKIHKIASWLEKNEFDVFYFGYCNWFLPVGWIRAVNIVKLPSPLCAHANLYSRSGMKKILEYVNTQQVKNKHLDKLLVEIPNLYKFGVFPMMNFQNKDPGLYKRAIKQLRLPNISFKTMSRFMEYMSVIIPFLFLIIFAILLLKLYSWIFSARRI